MPPPLSRHLQLGWTDPHRRALDRRFTVPVAQQIQGRRQSHLRNTSTRAATDWTAGERRGVRQLRCWVARRDQLPAPIPRRQRTHTMGIPRPGRRRQRPQTHLAQGCDLENNAASAEAVRTDELAALGALPAKVIQPPADGLARCDVEAYRVTPSGVTPSESVPREPTRGALPCGMR